ncbi:MAG: GNAT family N-acetyltransferase [Pseudomonadales bacterium]|nr:GNAT family N-acetyltransferase [Pseudomonadales bacterium]NRA18286.1 GNAT family N-acetyltransferase [Oceanospirillaceae bacterium]
MNYRFKTINLQEDFATCCQFRRDAHVVNFGSDQGFDSKLPAYKKQIQEAIDYLPLGNCHLWADKEIIGQTEMKFTDDPKVGYVGLLYLVPEYRGNGIGELLHQHSVEVFSAANKAEIQSSVGQSNNPALSFYQKHGWKSQKPSTSSDEMTLMKYAL